MRLLTLLLIFSLLSSCSISPSPSTIRVAYLIQQTGQLSQTELNKHTEVLVTNSFEELKLAARNRIALWIDKDAAQLVEAGWLDTMPQASYPIIMIGYNDTLLSFKYKLRICCFLGPADPDFSGAEPGFSVIERDSGAPGAPITMLQGFKQAPTVDDILKISNYLLDGKIKPTIAAQPPIILVTATP